MTCTILVVDDEKAILSALARLFDGEDDLSVVTAADGEAALGILASRPIGLVISDQLMPGMDGIALLAEVKRRHPEIPRVLMTSHEDIDQAKILELLGEQIPLIRKPWSADELRVQVRGLVSSAKLDREQSELLAAGLSADQIKRALRIRSRMQNPRPLGEIFVELGDLTPEQHERIVQERLSRLGIVDLLRESGVLDEKGFQAYLATKSLTPTADDRAILVGRDIVSEEQYLKALCSKHHIPFREPEVGLVDISLLARASFRYLLRQVALPERMTNGKLSIIVADPLNRELISELARIFDTPLSVVCSTRSKIEEALRTLERLRSDKTADSSALSLQYREIEDLPEGDETGEEAVQIVDYLLLRAIQLRASDVHVEVLKTKVRVRVRVDGVLHQLTDLPLEFAPRVVSRIKVLAGADIAEKRLHQDGRFFVKVEGREIDIRVSTYVSALGETVVMRLLDRGRGISALDQIGFAPRVQAAIEEIVLKTSSGLVLVTGPTGSGKTTTLYSFVEHANDPTEKVITCEDPVEYMIDGIVQCSVNSKTGPTFGDSLKAIVRQDPDTIVVGEVRDKVTASLALEAALTGHKVLSTFHTEDSVGAIIRLLEMGTEPFLVSSTIAAIVAQRLVRRICTKCRKPGQPAKPDLAFLNLQRSDLKDVQIWEAVGCSACAGAGYKGRLGIHEVLIPDDDLRDAILRRAPARELRDFARKLPQFLTLQEDGLLKVAAGQTTLSEIVANAPRDVGARPLSTLRKVAKLGRPE